MTDGPSPEQEMLIEKVKQLVAQSKRVQAAWRAVVLTEIAEGKAREEYRRERAAQWTLEQELAELCK